jgi:hypothetical protein
VLLPLDFPAPHSRKEAKFPRISGECRSRRHSREKVSERKRADRSVDGRPFSLAGSGDMLKSRFPVRHCACELTKLRVEQVLGNDFINSSLHNEQELWPYLCFVSKWSFTREQKSVN